MLELRWLAAPAALAAVLPALAGQYATPEEAARRSFPQATSFREGSVELAADEMASIAEHSGLPARSARWRYLTALDGDRPLGVVVLDSVVGKFELIDYAVAIGNDGRIRNVEILTYRESHGYEIRLAGWRAQFVGKDAQARLRVSEDIALISGATLSSVHVTDGVRRIVAMVQTLRAHRRL